MLRRYEGELLHDFDGKLDNIMSFLPSAISKSFEILFLVLRTFVRDFHPWTLGQHHRLHLEELNLLADHSGLKANDARLHER